MIYFAGRHDIPDLVPLALNCLESAGARGRLDRAAVEAGLRQLVADGDKVLVRSGRGMLGGFIMPLWCSPGWRMACEFIWWAEDRQWLPLLRAFEHWAQAQRADEVRIFSNLQPKAERIARVLARKGYEPREVGYRKVR